MRILTLFSSKPLSRYSFWIFWCVYKIRNSKEQFLSYYSVPRIITNKFMVICLFNYLFDIRLLNCSNFSLHCSSYHLPTYIIAYHASYYYVVESNTTLHPTTDNDTFCHSTILSNMSDKRINICHCPSNIVRKYKVN